MFKKSLAAIAYLFSSANALAFNDKYQAHLEGKSPLSHDVVEQMWNHFEVEFGSHMPATSKSEAERKNQFVAKLEDIIAHNQDPSSTYQKGINQFSAMTEEEFRAHFYLDQIKEEQHCSATDKRQSVKKSNIADAPSFWDWRDHNGVSPVKDQGHCGSCWTFSTVGALEAHSLVKYSTFDSLAEQQLVDCAQAYDNHGCNGGLPSHAFEYIEAAGGISTEVDYPYYAQDRECKVDSDTFALTVSGGSVNITEGDEDELLLALFAHGPVSIAFEVVDGFSDYKSGVYTSDVCKNGSSDVNHAVLAVGYGTCPKTGLDYWIVKNSWSTKWGDNGYFKIQRGVNMCGVAQCNSFPNDVVKIAKEPKFLLA